MSGKKIISWENWNEMEKMSDAEYSSIDYYSDVEDDENKENLADFVDRIPKMLSKMSSQAIHTPFGHVPADSRFKPSDRWQCWIGNTNFGITKSMEEKLGSIQGVSIVRVLDPYSFCIGVGKLFEFNEVRRKIENEICN